MTPNTPPTIREYEPARDRAQVRRCMVELQEFERGLEPALLKGEAMADGYLAYLLGRCSKTSGRLFVAETDRVVVGLVGVLARVLPDGPDEDPTPCAYVSDLIVLPGYRGRGIGRALLEHAEGFARASGATVLRVGVL